MNSIHCLLSLHYYFKSPICNQSPGGGAGDGETRTTSPPPDVAGKETTKGSQPTHPGTVLKRSGKRTVLLRRVKSHLTPSTRSCPSPPATSPILTRHLNKEVRAMIKTVSLSESSCPPNAGPDPAGDSPRRRTTRPFFLLLHHRSSKWTPPPSPHTLPKRPRWS